MRTGSVLILAWLLGASQSVVPPRSYGQEGERKGLVTGVWTGRYTNHDNGQSGDAYLDITEHADGTLTGKWGTDENTAVKIEHGERVTADLLQWEAVTEEKHQPRYRVRATLKGKTLELACTVTWREDGKVKGNTANSILTRK
jgi:hypothetical protein